MNVTKNYFSRKEAAEYMGISTRTLDRYRNDGLLPYYSQGPAHKVFISADNIEKFMEKHCHKGNG